MTFLIAVGIYLKPMGKIFNHCELVSWPFRNRYSVIMNDYR
jgi:hypothetical protein